MPQSENIIASKTISGNIDLFDINKHPEAPFTDEVKPELRLIGHTQEGFGLSWNSNKYSLAAKVMSSHFKCFTNL